MRGQRIRTLPPVTVVGSPGPRGSYLLGIQVQGNLSLAFGRFNGGRPISVSQGHYLYLGSAMGKRGASSLARRLMRHAGRSHNRPAHAIQALMPTSFQVSGLTEVECVPPQTKKIFWHIDYLLDREDVEISHVIVLCSPVRLEGKLSGLLLDDPCTTILLRGLGAGDAPGRTHLLRIDGGEEWWLLLVDRIERSFM